MATGNSHEIDARRADDAKPGPDRSFGFVFAAFCALVATYLLWHGREAFWAWTGAAAVFASLAVFASRALHPLNVLWFKFGMLLHHIINPIILGLMFVTVFLPMGLWMRIVGKRPLHLLLERRTDTSYWILRAPPGPPPKSFLDQF